MSTFFGLSNPLNAMQILFINILMDGMSAHFPFICYTAEARMFLQGHQVNRLELTLLIPL